MGRRMVLAVALVTAGLGVGPVEAGHLCIPDPVPAGFRTCGAYPDLDELPMRFWINLASAPPGLSGQQITNAVGSAIAEWNRSWPLPTGDLACPLVCLGGTTTAGADPFDGRNTISWGEGAGCGDTSIAITCVRTAGHQILDADIVLSSSRSWYQPRLVGGAPTEPVQVVAGELAVVYPAIGDTEQYDLLGGGRGRYDLQSVITHEIGHAIGLLDIGNPSAPYPSALSDAAVYAQTMYRWYYRGTTFKRTLAEGDVAGLAAIAVIAMVSD